MHPAKRVAVNTGFLYARMAITVFISLYATRLILNALGVGDFGLFNVVGGAIAMLTFLNNAMAGATQRFMSFAQGESNFDKQRSIFNVSTVLHFSIAIVVVLFLEVAGYFLFNGILKIQPDRLEVGKLIFQFMLVSTFFTIVSVPYDAVINAHENMFFVAILGIIEAILKLGIAIYITSTTYDKLIIYGLLMASLSILLLIIRRIYCHKIYKEVEININKYFDKPIFIEMSKFAGWSFLGSATSLIANYGQTIVINMFFGTIVNAAQGIANQVSGQLSAFAGTMLKALNPLIVKSEGAGNRDLMLKASLIGSKISFFLLAFFYIPVLIEMPYIFKLWLNTVPDYAIIFCKLLLIRMLIEQLFTTLTSSIAAVGKIKRFQIYNSILNFLPLVASYILFRIGFPPYIIYIIFILYAILSSGITLFFAKRDCGLSLSYFFTDVFTRSLLVFIITFALSSIPIVTMDDGVLRLLLVLSISVLSIAATVWLIGLTPIERTKIWKIIPFTQKDRAR